MTAKMILLLCLQRHFGAMKTVLMRNKALRSIAPIVGSCSLMPTYHLAQNNQLRTSSSELESSESDAGDGERGSKQVDLRLQNIESFHTLQENVPLSSYATNGMSTKRIKKLLQTPCCECQCRVSYKPLVRLCKGFWSLPKENQDGILWSLQSAAGPGSEWFIEGVALKKRYENTHFFGLDIFLCNRFIIV